MPKSTSSSHIKHGDSALSTKKKLQSQIQSQTGDILKKSSKGVPKSLKESISMDSKKKIDKSFSISDTQDAPSISSSVQIFNPISNSSSIQASKPTWKPVKSELKADGKINSPIKPSENHSNIPVSKSMHKFEHVKSKVLMSIQSNPISSHSPPSKKKITFTKVNEKPLNLENHIALKLVDQDSKQNDSNTQQLGNEKVKNSTLSTNTASKKKNSAKIRPVTALPVSKSLIQFPNHSVVRPGTSAGYINTVSHKPVKKIQSKSNSKQLDSDLKSQNSESTSKSISLSRVNTKSKINLKSPKTSKEPIRNIKNFLKSGESSSLNGKQKNLEKQKSTSSIKSNGVDYDTLTPSRRRFTTRTQSDLISTLSNLELSDGDSPSTLEIKKLPFDMLQNEHVKLISKFDKVKEERDIFEKKYKSLQEDFAAIDTYCKSLKEELKSVEAKYNTLVAKYNKQAINKEKTIKMNGLKLENMPELSGKVYTSEKQTNILTELLNTEKDYVKTLRMIQSHFYEPIRQEKLMSESEQRQIFGNIEMVRQINELFLKDLETILEPPNTLQSEVKSGQSNSTTYTWRQYENVIDLISRVFVSFKLYCGYIGAYQNSIMQLNNLLKKNANLKKFMKNTETALKNSKARSSNLQSLLITPVQRPPRYRLLVEQLCKATDTNSNLHVELQNALTLICEICDYLNSRNAEIENSMKIVEIQEQLHINGLIQPSRKFIYESKNVNRINKNGKATKNPGIMYIFNDLILFCKTNSGLLGKKISEIQLQPGTQLNILNDTSILINTGTKQQTFQFGNGDKSVNTIRTHEAFISLLKY